MLIIINISSLIFINIFEPPISIWKQTDYVKSWLLKHRSTEDNRSRKIGMPKVSETSLWKIL